MKRIQIMVKMEMPEETAPEYTQCQPSLEEKVRDAIIMVDSGHESDMEWEYLKRVYDKLESMKPTKRINNLLEMMHPVLAKFGKIEAMPIARPAQRKSELAMRKKA